MNRNAPLLLALDTAGERSSAALRLPDGRVFETVERVGNRHAERLLDQVAALLQEAGCSRREIGLVAFGAGPGSFTGLRVACGTAQGVAWALQIDTVPVSNLEALACRAQKALALPKGTRIAVLNDARMNECYAALYEADPEGLPVTIEEAKLVKPADAPDWVRENGAAVVAGSAAAAYPEELKLPDDVQVYSETADAVDMLEIAFAAYQNGKTVPPALAAPLYVRDRVALTSEERRRGEKL